MKRILVLVLCVCLMSFTLAGLGACTPRDEKLIIYNWGEYMPKSVRDGFSKWYKEQTGEKVVVKYDTYDTNEDMYSRIKKRKADYDLICPSEYMLERMQKENLLIKLDDETLEVIERSVNNDLLDMMVKETRDYTMPYIWGTLGILYNAKSGFSKEEMSSWSVLFEGNQGKSQRVWMKDSVRDSYSAAMIYKYKAQLLDKMGSENYRPLLESIFSIEGLNESEVQANINLAKSTLQKQKDDNYVKSYDVDAAKEEMLAANNNKEFGLFWSCDAGYVMNGWEKDNNQDLRYVVPEEGSNVWVDGFAIPKYAKNKKAANYFIRYLCEGEITVKGEMVSTGYLCMDYVGASSAVTAAAEAYREDLENDESFWNDPSDLEFRQMYMDMMFPDENVLARCAVMRDFAPYNSKLTDMWEAVLAYKP